MSTRRLIQASGVVTVAALCVAGWLLHGLLAVGVGYKAKMLCSGVFVSRLDVDTVLQTLEVDDLEALKYISVSINSETKTATASLFGALTRRAVFRNGLGCALVLDDLEPPTLPDRSARRDVRIGEASPAGGPQRLIASRAGTDDAQPRRLDAALERAFSEPDPLHRRRTLAVVVMHRGQIVAERYGESIGADTPLPGWSMTKSVMNALVGTLVHNHKLSLDAPVALPEWQRPGDPRTAITVDQLLRMSSGLRFDEDMTRPRSDVMRMLFGTGDVAAFAAGKKLAFAPGTVWQYSSGTSNIISRVIHSALPDEASYLSFPRRALFDLLGMSGAVLETDATGTFIGSSYMYATAREWGRFGTLYLQDGVWNGERLLPEGWVAYTTSPAPADTRKHYGAHFWLQVPDEYAGADHDIGVPAFHAVGHEGQFVTIVPSRDLVVVRLGRTRYPQAWDHPAFVRAVVAAIDVAIDAGGSAEPRPTGR